MSRSGTKTIRNQMNDRDMGRDRRRSYEEFDEEVDPGDYGDRKRKRQEHIPDRRA